MTCRDDEREVMVDGVAGVSCPMWVVVGPDGPISGWPDQYAARHAQMVYEEETKQPARVIVVDVWVPRG